MIQLTQTNNLDPYQEELGGQFSFLNKVKLGGIGSPKLIYQKGIKEFDQLKTANQDLNYINFELFPNAIVGRFTKKGESVGVIISQEEIEKIQFESRRIKISTRWGVRIVQDATIQFKLHGSIYLLFHCPVTFYKPAKHFFSKSWLQFKSQFSMNPAPPVWDKEASILSVILG